jgi:hypothetical protein
MRRIQLPRSLNNPISIVGAAIALVVGITLAFFLVLILTAGEENPYLGIFVYLVLPAILILGLLLIPIGAWRKRRRVEKQLDTAPTAWPVLDLNNAASRNAFLIFVTGTLLLGLGSVVGGYQAFHYTESVEFCGTTCHAVMEPEHTAYLNSAHARVMCVSCHVGGGADWYARSKINGLHQVYGVVTNSYERPIPTPVHNLRPATDTCEQCHWPEKNFGSLLRRFDHFMYDEENTHWPIDLLIKVGGGRPDAGQEAGIHWHMNVGVDVEYIARDEHRQDIPWVRVTERATGRVTVYQNEEDPLDGAAIAAATPRRMDCIDCHNRSGHDYLTADRAIDAAMVSGRIDRSLPEIKRVAVEALAEEYPTREEAMAGIAGTITDFYADSHPDLAAENATAVEAAVAAARHQYADNFFPRMKVRWDAYPNNIGHMAFAGCMRCHNGLMVSDEGATVTRDCNACHTILRQGPEAGAQVVVAEGLEFEHPDGWDDWRDTDCHECHAGVQP